MNAPSIAERVAWAWRVFSRSPARLLFTIVSLLAIALELNTLFSGRHVEYGGAKPRTVDEFASGNLVAQAFTAPYDGIDSVTLFFAPHADTTGTRVWLRLLRDTPDGYSPVASAVLEPEAGADALVFRFPIQVRCTRHSFRVEARALEPGPPLQAFSEGSVHPGTMSVAGTEQWGDLRLVVGAASRYRTLIASIAAPNAAIGNPIIHLILLALGNWALLRFAYGLTIETSGNTTDPR